MRLWISYDFNIMVYSIPDIPKAINAYLDVRERYERRIDRDFNSSANDNRSDLYSRWRVGLNGRLDRDWTGQVEYQFSHDLIWTNSKNSSTANSDVSLAFGEFKKSGSTVDIGRQKIALGNQRLIGPAEWLNVPRSLDAVRYRGHALDIWAGKVGLGVNQSKNIRLAGASVSSRLGLSSMIYKHDEVGGVTVDHFTIDELYVRRFSSWDVDFEGAAQFGRSGDKDQRAYALHGQVGYRLDPKARVFAEGNYASGGSGPSTNRTFDNLYPSNHDKYGVMDLQAWKNMEELVGGVEYRPTKTQLARLSWHDFFLADASDAWYGATGLPNKFSKTGMFVDSTGHSGRNVGQEVDLEYSWALKKNVAFSAALASFAPGSFIRNVSGHDDHQSWLYLSLSGKF